jgi:xylulokinase
MEALLSIDLGTTAIKAAVYSLEGQALGEATLEYPLISPRPGWVEQDPEMWWSLAIRTARVAAAQAGEAVGARICGLAVSSQGISFVPVDRVGAPLCNALCWLDTRAAAEASAVREQIGDDRLFRVTGKRPSAAYVLPKLLWLRAHAPDLYARTDRFLLAHDFLVYRMCGAQVIDPSLAGGTLLLDLHSLSWSADLLAAFDLSPARLPGLAWAGTRAGELSGEAAGLFGLQPGIPVVVGGQDQKCAALGAAIRPGVATVSLGTASAISCLADRPLLDPQRRIPCFPFVIPGFWVLEGVVGTAGAALRWLRAAFFPQDDFVELDAWAARAEPGANGVRFYPHLAGATSPLWQAEARGAFAGLSLAAGKADLVRSVLEGVAFQIRANLEAIEGLAPVNELILFGGGARSRLWNGIIAAVTGKAVRVARTVNVANWGACLLAGIGAGKFRDAQHLPTPAQAKTVITPEAGEVRRYQELYEAYITDDQAFSKR